MKTKTLLFIIFLITITKVFGYNLCTTCPKDNPMETFYGDSGDYAFWTDEINWANVVDMSVYSNGANNFEKFKNACNEMYNAGGGVLFYPAGTYNFDIPDGPNDEGLMLKKGVVIRGVAPTSDKRAITSWDISNTNADKTDGLSSLATKFVFTQITMGSNPGGLINKMWNCIGAKKGTNEAGLHQVSHIGVAWVEIKYGYIYFGMENYRWASSWAVGKGYVPGSQGKNGWTARVPNGTIPFDHWAGLTTGHGLDTGLVGTKRFVFGCKMVNAGCPNYILDKPSLATWVMDPHPFAWTGKITAYGSHIFIANNVISKPTVGFKYDYTCKSKGHLTGTQNATYDYGYGIGIDVNKSSASAFANRCYINGNLDNIYYAEDVIIQDNWIYNHGDKSIEAVGKWIVIKQNFMPRNFLAHNDNVYGFGASTVGVNWSNGRCFNAETTDDMLSRAMDLGGWNAWFTKNYYKRTGCNFANDGEGMLFQRHNGIEAYSIAETYNRSPGSISGGDDGYIAPYDVHVIGLFQGWNYQQGNTGINATRSNWIEDVSAPEEINFTFTGIPKVPSGTSGLHVKDFYTNCVSTVTSSDKITGLNLVVDLVNRKTTITYTDNSTKEIAFRIEKKPNCNTSDPWTVIAYRPRQETSTNMTLADTAFSNKTFGYPSAPHKSYCYPSYMKVDDMNPRMWVDYKSNVLSTFEYRVVAIDCDNTNAAAPVSLCTKFVERYSDIVKSISLKIRPNPSAGSTTIEYALFDDETATVEVLDINGKLVKILATNTWDQSVILPAGTLNAGTYLIKVSNNKGSTVIDKLIVL